MTILNKSKSVMIEVYDFLKILFGQLLNLNSRSIRLGQTADMTASKNTKHACM